MTRNEQILGAIFNRLDNSGKLDPVVYDDALSCIRNIADEAGRKDLELSRELKGKIRVGRLAAKDSGNVRFLERMYDLNRRVLLWEATDSFDSFMLYNEINRPLKEQFWLPRRSQLMGICNALQRMEDGELDELFLSQPPRTGKTTLMVMFMLWVMGRNSERSNLYCSYTDSVVGVFYNGILEILNDPTTYSYYDIFPTTKVASTNAKDLLINLDRKKRYASFTGRSLYGTLNGACDCNGYCIADDLHSGIEEILSPDRLKSAWDKVDNNLIPRVKMGGRLIWEGTRWSVADCIARRQDLVENDPKYAERRVEIINVPALDEHDESNFDYKYGVGFSSDYYQQRRASFERNSDMASWFAQYMGTPVDRDGSVFSPDALRYYNGELPDGDPDRVFMAIDPAWGGGDYTAAPVVYQYGDDLYISDVVFDDGEKTVTQPLIVNAVKKYGVQAVKVEGTKMTASYGEDIDRALRNDGIRVNMQINTSHFTGNGKRQRIFDKAPEIRERMVFLSDGHRSKEYQQFMTNMFAFTVTGKAAKHDDACDALSMVCDMAFKFSNKAEIMQRPW